MLEHIKNARFLTTRAPKRQITTYILLYIIDFKKLYKWFTMI